MGSSSKECKIIEKNSHKWGIAATKFTTVAARKTPKDQHYYGCCKKIYYSHQHEVATARYFHIKKCKQQGSQGRQQQSSQDQDLFKKLNQELKEALNLKSNKKVDDVTVAQAKADIAERGVSKRKATTSTIHPLSPIPSAALSSKIHPI
eukprot:scaffold22649_cov66-Cyclotella_meneghiniana.AAC.10